MIAQLVFNKLQKQNPQGILFKGLQKLRYFLVNINPSILVNYRYHNYTLKLPLSHDYPFNRLSNPHYSQNLGEIAKITAEKYPATSAIDVGANIGDSAQIIQHFINIPILCVEGNSKFIPLLQNNTSQLNNIAIAECFVGESEEKVTAIHYLGTSRLEKSEDGAIVMPMNKVLENFPDFKKAKLLKIDTDGFDNKIIRASEKYLQEAKPIVFFEYDPRLLKMQNERGYDIFSFLNVHGYRKLLLFDNLGSFLCELGSDQEAILKDLTNYYLRDKHGYLDVCAIHQEDEDLVAKIKDYYS